MNVLINLPTFNPVNWMMASTWITKPYITHFTWRFVLVNRMVSVIPRSHPVIWPGSFT